MKALRWTQENMLFVVSALVVVVFYALQSLIGLWALKSHLVGLLAGLSIIALAVFSLVYFAFPVGWVRRLGLSRLKRRHLDALCISGVLGYLVVLTVSIATADNVAFFAAFAGCSASDLAEFRETFLRTREGFGQALNYLYVICNNSVMPFAVTYAFWARKRWRFLALAVFIFGLSLTLQKGNILSAGLPLIALYAITARTIADLRNAIPAAAMIVFAVGLMYFLAGGHAPQLYRPAQSCSEASEIARIDREITGATGESRARPALVSAVPDRYNITGSNSQIALIANRIFWIPYVTAIDWLRYWEEKLDGQPIMGRSIKLFAALTGKEPISLEREVARLQWGQNEQGTASSNAIYFVDAWVNFGALGVIGYAALFGLVVRLVTAQRFPPLIAGAVVPVYTAGFVALPPIFLSGGLFVILLLAVLMKPGEQVETGQ